MRCVVRICEVVVARRVRWHQAAVGSRRPDERLGPLDGVTLWQRRDVDGPGQPGELAQREGPGRCPRVQDDRGRAVLANPGYFLTPGMFGNMRLASAGTRQALLVPDDAVQTDQARKVLLTVDANNVVTQKAVELGPVVDGLRIIRSGLGPKDRVIITGTQMAIPGAKVAPHAGRIAAQPRAAASVTAAPLAGEATLAP